MKVANLFYTAIVALSLIQSKAFAESDLLSKEDDFAFYFVEFTNNELDRSEPMAKLIVERLSESLFDTTDKDEFEKRIRLLKNTLNDRPELIERFHSLNARLQSEFENRVSKAKEKRMIYTIGGAVVGAAIGIPAGKLLSSSTSMGSKILFITIPAGALVGGGAGFLLGNLIAMPHYQYRDNEITSDLDLMSKDLENLSK